MDNSHRDIQVWLKEYIEYITNSVSRNANYLETLTVVIEELKKLRTDIQRDITENEEQLKSSKEKLSNINRSKEKLLNMRDEVQICKLLTNTTFTYKASSIGGYTVGANSKKREFFEMNVKEFSKDEIINNLYNCLAEVSSTTKGSDTNKRLNNLEPV
ncbi:hypothetical protein NQ315_007928 [Exocentrus adspersus]|uniref:Uncharacterized protein n=1 Tax=Exocentrus adspersus TaxID=1586481 RepID=A0AAV8W8B4_9CUCU|nr:hypothetical protein NQ315_007928 [Exocentrus adspersus]